MKKNLSHSVLVYAWLLLAGLTPPGYAATQYWDINGATPGAGGAWPGGAWTGAFWSTDPTGSSATTTFTSGDAAVFSAGTDATGEFTVSGNATVGSILVEEGAVSINSPSTITLGAGNVTINSGATFSTDNSLRIAATAGATMTINGGTLRTSNSGAAGTFIDTDFVITLNGACTFSHTTANVLNIVQTATKIGGTGSLTKSGAGVLAFACTAGNNTYSGATIVTDGELRIRTVPNTLPITTALAVTSPGIFNLNGVSQQVGSLTGTGNVGAGAGTLTISGSASTTFNGALKNIANAGAGGVTTGNGKLTKSGSGTITFAGANDINGTVTLTAGGIIVNSGASLCGPICDVVVNGGTLNLNNNAQTIENLSGTGGTINLGTGHTLTSEPVGSTTYSGTIAAAGSLTRLNANATIRTLTLSGPKTYDGNTVINKGIISVGSATALGSTVGYTEVQSGGEVLFTGATTAFTCSEPFRIAGVGAGDNGAIAVSASATPTLSGPVFLIGDATVTVSSVSTATFNNANAFSSLANQNLTLQGGSGAGGGGTISGIIALGTGGLTKLQSGTWILSAANNYSGGTTVSAGTLDAQAPSSLGSGNVNVTAGVLKLSNASAMDSSATLTLPAASSGNVSLNFTGTQTISALYFSTTQKAAGTWGAVGSGAAHQNAAFTGTGLLNVTSGGAVTSTLLTSITPDPSCEGIAVSLTATVAGDSPGGNVEFFDGASSLGTASLSGGQATLSVSSLAIGTHANITAQYLGDANNNGSISGASALTVNPTPSCAITGAGSVCSNSIANSYSAPAGMSSYAWSISGNGTISGVTDGQSVSVDAGEAGSFGLHLVVADGVGCSSSCDTTVTVFGAPAISTDLTNLTVCVGSPAEFYVAANGLELTWQWQLSTDSGANWTDISTDGTYSSYTNTATLSEDDGNQYRVVVVGCSQSVTSAPAVLTVNPLSVGGTVAAADSTVYAGSATIVSLSGETGSIVKWQSSTDGGLNWIDIASTANPLNTGNLTTTTEFRAVVQSGFASSTTSSAATVTVLLLPVANDDSLSGYMNQPLTFNVSALLANDSEPNGFALTVASVDPTSSQLGTVALNGTQVTYTPPAWYFGMDDFGYTISNGHGATATAQVQVYVSDGMPPVSIRASIAPTPTPGFMISFTGVPGQKYDIQRSTNSVDWTTLATVSATLQNRVVHHEDTNPPPGAAFYRIKLQ